MRIVDRESAEGRRERITLVPETLDDLWHLTYVLEPGDLVAGDTTRRIQRDDDKMRDTGGEREPMWIRIDVNNVEFAKFANRLRVGGDIVDCSREDQLGFHHTFNVEEHDELTVEKVWQVDQLERLEEAVEAAEQPDVAIATVEEGQAHIHTVAQYGVEERASITGTTGKGEYARSRDELFEELAAILRRLDAEAIILAGPGFTKQDALEHIEDNAPEAAEKIQVVDTASVGDRGVHEVLKRGAVDRIQTETRVSKEAELIDELMERIGEGEKAAYGVDEVAEAAEFGAIETLLILDERLREERAGEGDWAVDVNDIIENVEQQGGEVVVFSHEFDPGQQLANLGGIAALLRYRLS
ncbi:mRNA surveillance protein pelota [Natronomonas pharaonis DSM 2160]|uniref:Protein pelota homolog n=1 Tax=Natronomonas pharaonis (strain ATCC 35678 / DSM 2160 / CIP 103997 / JCM 8858 / NBRC 14720 / NCIMB 2260 / Gabara) TaxID=348780 RepID=PELO_NATPD|nr:mRNA surveillance protein pelota [Natronomonas pharaonis]Q3INN9.1 RecName: Full=Protein pelota homolog [Natronomonas pharaonis DSM 2160]CAI50263.1 mRNA surveillance protein pelota [Natronomonas pharaonis DSM 2160]